MNIALKILIFTLPLVCSNLPEFFWWSDIWRINGNYEFFKVLYFNIFSSAIIIWYAIWVLFKRHHLKTSKNTLILLSLFFIINIASTLFSIYPMESLLWWVNKGHGMLFWNNIIGLTIVLLSLKKTQLNSLITSFLYSVSLISLLGIWQYYLPSFDYWNLWNRAISTLGHPNYLAWLILISISLLSTRQYIKNSFVRYSITFIALLCLFLTKSWLAIVLFLLYTIARKIKFKRYSYLYPSIILLVWAIVAFIQFPEKLHSFVSRFYIWETTLSLIASDVSRLLSWFGPETLTIYFDNFKSPELYIFENFWFTADRPHNIFLNFLYHFWLVWVAIIISIYYFISKNLKSAAWAALWLIALFLLFNYASVALYLIIVILLASLVKTSGFPQPPLLKGAIMSLFLVIMLTSIWSIYYSSKLYLAERSIYLTSNYQVALEILPSYQVYQHKNKLFHDPVESEQYYLQKLYFSPDYLSSCNDLVTQFPSVENYFYCWDVLEQTWENTWALPYYTKWVDKLPDIWNADSLYWENPIIKKSISWNRFYSKKYWDIWTVLEKLDIKKTSE